MKILKISCLPSNVYGAWTQVNVPEGCKPKQISADSQVAVFILCEDGRVFH